MSSLPGMSKPDRFDVVLQRLASEQSIAVEDLARELKVSGATVRRDLRELARQSLLTKTHGGAVARDLTYELPVRYRSGRQSEQKRRIGVAAATLVPEGAVVGISGGTTTTQAVPALAGRPGLTVVTNALNIATQLALRPNIQLMVTGGLARSASFELVGPVAESTIRSYNLDVMLLGVDGIDAKMGCTTHDHVEAETNTAMVQQAKQVIVLADATKIGRVAFAGICRLDEVDILITEKTTPATHHPEHGDGNTGNGLPPDGDSATDELQRLLDAGLQIEQV